MTRRRRTLAAALAAVVLVGCAPPEASCERIPGVRPGLCPLPVADRAAAPTDALPVLGGTGRTASLADSAGRVTVVNFWASWCGPCRLEQPELNAAAELLPGVAFVGVSIEDTEVNALAHLREFGVPYPSLFDPVSALAARFGGIGPRTIPSTVILDAEGRVAVRILGTTTYPELLGLVGAIADGADVAAAGGS